MTWNLTGFHLRCIASKALLGHLDSLANEITFSAIPQTFDCMLFAIRIWVGIADCSYWLERRLRGREAGCGCARRRGDLFTEYRVVFLFITPDIPKQTTGCSVLRKQRSVMKLPGAMHTDSVVIILIQCVTKKNIYIYICGGVLSRKVVKEGISCVW